MEPLKTDTREEFSVCLEVYKDVATLNSCIHRFCFVCIFEWSKIKPECPYCKSKFKSITHFIDGIKVITLIVDNTFPYDSSDFDYEIPEVLDFLNLDGGYLNLMSRLPSLISFEEDV